MSMPHSSGSSSSPSICTWWVRGFCKYGDSCRFLHGKDVNKTFYQRGRNRSDGSDGDYYRRPLTFLSTVAKARGGNWRSKVHEKFENRHGDMGRNTNGGSDTPVYTFPGSPICRYWKAGNCIKGEECQYRHDPEVSQQVSHSVALFQNLTSADEADEAAMGDNCRFRAARLQKENDAGHEIYQEFEPETFSSMRTPVCSYWEAGDCVRGDHCRFLHDPKIASANVFRVASQQLKMALEKANQEHKRSLEQEKSAHQAREAAAQEIQYQKEVFIATLESIEHHFMERRAQFEAGDHEAGEVADDSEKHQHSLSMEKANEHKLWLTQETIEYEGRVAKARENHALRLEGANKEYKRRLAEEAAAVEASEIAASEHQRQLQALRNEEAEITEQYAVLGESSLITCRAGIDVQNVVTGFDICRIIIKNLPRHTKYKEISDILVHSGMKTSDFFVLDFRFGRNCREATVLVITDHGRKIAVGLKDTDFRDHTLTFEVSETPNGSTMGSSPRNVRRSLPLSRLGALFTGNTKPFLTSLQTQNLLQYKTIVALQQYEAQKKKWDALSKNMTGSDAHLQINTSTVKNRKTVLICVLGQDKKAIGSLKVRVEGMVAGERLDSHFWHPSFLTPDGKAFFERIYKDKKVYVRSDLKFRVLRLYGEANHALEEARQMIKEEINRLARLETTVVLDQKSIGFFMSQGLGRLLDLLGEENVVLSFVPGRCEITIRGGEEERHHLNRLIRESQAAQPLEQIHPEKDEKVTCPICYDEISHPEQLGCGHIYCSGCLRHYLASAPENKTFPLVCLGDKTACKMPISLPLIRRFMTPQSFQALVEAAFRSYLDQHSQELKYCPTPDCQQIYRHSVETRALQCPSCFSSICSTCDDDSHEGMTCKERRDQKDPSLQDRLFNEWANKHGQRCPECRSVVEKISGCNHITCRCGAHLCWTCGMTFKSNEIYPHMSAAHGGYF